MGKVVIIMAVVFTIIFASITFTLKSRTQVIPDLLAEGMASDNAGNLGAYALKYAILRLQEADGSPKGADTGEKIDENTVMEYGNAFEVISEGYINTISWDFVEEGDYSYPNGSTSQEPQKSGNGWGRNRYRWHGGDQASFTVPASWDYALASTSMYLPVARAGRGNGNGNNGNGNGNTGVGNQGNEKPVGNAGGNGNGNNGNTTPGIPRGNQNAWAWAYGWGQNGHAPSGATGEDGDSYRIVHIVADVSWYTKDKLYTSQAEAVVELSDGSIDGEIAYWPFDEGSGTIVSDNSDIGNSDGSITNMNNNDWVTGKEGTALDFDGYDDYVQFGKDVDDNIEDQLTIGIWAKAAEYPDDPHAYDWGRLVSSSHKNGSKPDWYLRSRVLDIATHGQTLGGEDYTIQHTKEVSYYFGVYNGRALFGLLPKFGQVSVTLDEKANPDLDIYDWHYISGRYDGNYSSDKAEIMVKVVDEDIKDTAIVDKWITHGNDNIVSIGGVRSPFSWLSFLNSVRCYDGIIDEVRLLNKAATEDEMVDMSRATTNSGNSDFSVAVVFWRD